MTKTKMNKNLIIQLLTREVKQLRTIEDFNQGSMKALRKECDMLIDQKDHLRDRLHYAHQEARNAEDKLSNSTVSLDALQFLLNRDRVRKEKINAIKTVRKITDCGLRDAKEFVEAYIDGNLNAEPNDLGSILASALKQ